MVKAWSTKCGLEQIKVRPKRSWWHNFISGTVTALIDLTYEGEGTHKSCKNSSFVWPCSSFFFFQVTTSTHPLGLNKLWNAGECLKLDGPESPYTPLTCSDGCRSKCDSVRPSTIVFDFFGPSCIQYIELTLSWPATSPTLIPPYQFVLIIDCTPVSEFQDYQAQQDSFWCFAKLSDRTWAHPAQMFMP